MNPKHKKYKENDMKAKPMLKKISFKKLGVEREAL